MPFFIDISTFLGICRKSCLIKILRISYIPTSRYTKIYTNNIQLFTYIIHMYTNVVGNIWKGKNGKKERKYISKRKKGKIKWIKIEKWLFLVTETAIKKMCKGWFGTPLQSEAAPSSCCSSSK